MAAGPDRVFIVSPDGVLAFSPLLRRWEGPFIPPVPGALERVTAGMIDPLDNSLWLSAFDGWVHFQPDVQVWERGEAGGRLLDFAFDLAAPFEGLHFRTSTGWFKVPRGALVPIPASAPIRPVRPATVEQALASNPALGGRRLCVPPRPVAPERPADLGRALLRQSRLVSRHRRGRRALRRRRHGRAAATSLRPPRAGRRRDLRRARRRLGPDRPDGDGPVGAHLRGERPDGVSGLQRAGGDRPSVYHAHAG